ncbi:LysR family transcriptional regulator [Pseudomonas sp. YuFO8]|jgi:DNA-binding transcriptional LysR family regulator|uniref:LysR family transcriptional regulator n=1 Tax=Pseudomonas sp. YuFO8 TaxID=3095361 RepID=UPI002B243560|nr:LysR family transcriptional regulator [Pseudomonas sp. YuFO8]MEB2623749.1 LysR family transcriptional regulator [Pseudomonas sp. YuFO8]
MLVNLTDVDLRMLRIFCSIVDAGGFTAAQVPLNTSLSRLSVLVRDLEVRLGYSLCKRGKSGFQLTEEGEETYAAAQELFSNIGHFRQRTAVLSGRHRDLLRIGTVDSLITLTHSPIPAVIAQLRAAQPSVHIDLHVMRPDELEQAVLEERIQVAIGAFHHRLSGLHYQALFEEEQNLYCSSGHPFFLRSDQNLTFEELSAADYVDRGYVAENKRPCELRFASAVSAFSMEAIALLILSDTYIGYLPTHYAASWVERGRLRSIMPQRLGYRSAFHCITRQGVEQKGTVSGFLDALTAHAELHL